MVRSIKNLIASILISISAFMAWTNILPKYNNTSEIKLAIEVRRALVDSRRGILERIKNLQNEYDQRFSEIQRLSLVVPEEKGFPEFISTIESISSRTGIILGELSIGGGGVNNIDPFNTINFDANFKTSYESLISFLDYLESNIRLIDLTGLNIILKKDDIGGTNGLAPLEVQIKTKAYYLKEDEEIQRLNPGVNLNTEE